MKTKNVKIKMLSIEKPAKAIVETSFELLTIIHYFVSLAENHRQLFSFFYDLFSFLCVCVSCFWLFFDWLCISSSLFLCFRVVFVLHPYDH